LAQVHLANTQHAIKGRTDGLLGDERCLVGNLRIGLIEMTLIHIHLTLGDGVTLHQAQGTLEADAIENQLCFESAQFGLLHGIVELHQQLAFSGCLPGIKVNAHHLAGQFGGHIHALDGTQRTHGLQPRLPSGLLCRERRHGGGLLGHLGHDLVDHAVLVALEGVDPEQEPPHDAKGNEHANQQTNLHGDRFPIGMTSLSCNFRRQRDPARLGS